MIELSVFSDFSHRNVYEFQEIKAEKFREMKIKGIKEVCANTG